MQWLYDLLVVHGTYWAAWGCRWPHIAALYRENLRERHLEVAPGTAYLPNKVGLPGDAPELHLFDLHEGSLDVSERRLARYNPRRHQGDVLSPFPEGIGRVESVAATNLLHCVRGIGGGGIASKAPIFDHVAAVLEEGGTFFGTTVVRWDGIGTDVPMSRFGRRVLARMNDQGIFANLSDSREELERELATRFDDVHVELRGAMALWSAKGRGPGR
ncbi:hypothetical protein ACFO4E_02040 [Nocardiopsis mangrovi]|uniref:Methyltransferase type 11 domain-containing protein n=1 Tax=Nocardiopsis mangrovi TaxID=1179818 RepID=A0ABV9DPN3_9ACTN